MGNEVPSLTRPGGLEQGSGMCWSEPLGVKNVVTTIEREVVFGSD